MANFEPIVEWLLYQEDDHQHPGILKNIGDGAGLTRLGITSKNFGSVMPADFWVEGKMSFAQAVSNAKWFYEQQYWHHINGDRIHDDGIAAALLSFSVNKSVPTAVKVLQKVLGVTADGVLGLVSLGILNQKDPTAVLNQFRAGWITYYHEVVDQNPDDAKFLNGWINRANFPYPSSLVGSVYA